MNWLLIFGCSVIGFGVAFLVIPLALRFAGVIGGIRANDFHHTHKTPVPRFGGLALAAALVVTELFLALLIPEARSAMAGRIVILFASLAMFALGFLDDLKPVRARVKLLGQISIALVVHFLGIGIVAFKVPFTEHIIDLQGWGVLVTVVWLVGMTNLINLIDGVDGLAGGISFMLMALLVYVGHKAGSFELIAAGMAGAILAFLYFNFPPAKIYLGDGGAYMLGFMIGALSLTSSNKGTVFGALVAPLFVLALPILDTSLAIVRRGLRGLPVFRPDQRHLHHHLLRSGFSRRKVVLLFYAATLVFLLLGFAAFWSRGQLIPVLFGVGVLLLLLFAGAFKFSREWFAVGRTLGNSLAMREEIQYALCLIRWLECEGERCASLDELFSDFTFAARRLGFSRVTLTLPEGARSWSVPGAPGEERAARYSLEGGGMAAIELAAPYCVHGPAQICPLDSAGQPARNCPCISDSRLFEIIGELLAEGWVKASAKWHVDQVRSGQDEVPVVARKKVARRSQPAAALESAAKPQGS